MRGMSALSSLSRGARGRANGERTLSSARFACASARVLSRGIIHINQLSACGAVTVDRKCAELAGAAALSAWVKCRASRASCCRVHSYVGLVIKVILCCWHEVLKMFPGTQSLHSENHAKRATKPLPRAGNLPQDALRTIASVDTVHCSQEPLHTRV